MEQPLLTLIQNIMGEALAFWFLTGLVFFILGAAFIGIFILTRLLGERTSGTVIGAILETRVKKKIRDGKEVEKIKETLYPIYAYTRSDGVTRQERGSEGGSMTLKYTTGQKVNLIIRKDTNYDDVYDLNEMGAFYLGIVLAVIGGILMLQIGSAISAIGMSALSLFGIVVFKIISSLFDKKTPLKNASQKEHHKAFAPEDIQPIEAFKKA